jgi:hypothetical protein
MRIVVCLKWGKKYSFKYVNTLYNMVKRHSLLTDKFVCITDDTKGLLPNIETRPLPALPLQGWWFKPYVFCKELNFSGEVLFLDLDLVIFKNMDQLWTIDPEKFFIIRDFTRHMYKDWNKFNSSVFRFHADTTHYVWEKFYKDHQNITRKFPGDQDFLHYVLKDTAKTWPDEWIQSYKWEMRDRSDIAVIDGKRNFTTIKNPKIDNNCFIAVFHGDPKPENATDPWVIENWK